MRLPRTTARTPRRLVAVASVLLFIAGTGATRADAAAPDSAGISLSSPSTTWNGGPFFVPNTTATTGSLACDQVTVCDDFTLTVDVPAGYGAGHDLELAVGWPASNADFDVYLYDGAGNEVAEAASTADPELLSVPATAGRYTVRVVPYNPLGQSYWAMAEVAKTPAGG